MGALVCGCRSAASGVECMISFAESLRLPRFRGKIIEALFLEKAKQTNTDESLQYLKRAVQKAL